MLKLCVQGIEVRKKKCQEYRWYIGNNVFGKFTQEAKKLEVSSLFRFYFEKFSFEEVKDG